MAVRIEPTDSGTFTVNGKEVYLDMNNNWIRRPEEPFTAQEQKAWRAYKKIAIDGKGKNPIMTFKYNHV